MARLGGPAPAIRSSMPLSGRKNRSSRRREGWRLALAHPSTPLRSGLCRAERPVSTPLREAGFVPGAWLVVSPAPADGPAPPPNCSSSERCFGAETALCFGIVNAVGEDGGALPMALEKARIIAELPPASVQLSKAPMKRSWQPALTGSLRKSTGSSQRTAGLAGGHRSLSGLCGKTQTLFIRIQLNRGMDLAKPSGAFCGK